MSGTGQIQLGRFVPTHPFSAKLGGSATFKVDGVHLIALSSLTFDSPTTEMIIGTGGLDVEAGATITETAASQAQPGAPTLEIAGDFTFRNKFPNTDELQGLAAMQIHFNGSEVQ